jgi:predicted ATPase
MTVMTAVAAGGPQSLHVSLKQLYLDPNNYRFIDHKEYTPVPEAKRFDANVQARTEVFILGKNQENVRDLVDSLKKSGWLPIDQIQVQEIAQRPGEYVVVEGNRRVATLKHLQRRHEEAHIDLGALKTTIFDAVPVNTYADKDQAHYRVLMGLKHISGNKKWPALNQAKLLRAMQRDDGMSPDDVCKAIGIRRQELNVSMRTLAMCDIYTASEYGDQFRTEQYNLFQEIVKSTAIKAWIGWNDKALKAENDANVERLFSLISEDTSGTDDAGQVRPTEPAITTSMQIRELAKIVEDPVALKNLERTRSLTEATLSSEVLVKNRLERSIEVIDDQIRILSNHSRTLKGRDLEEVRRLTGLLRGVELSRSDQGNVHVSPGTERIPFRSILNKHFSNLHVTEYRRLRDIRSDGLRRINIFAGLNNAGKTSVLEAVYLLTQQDHPDAAIEIVARRGRFDKAASGAWIAAEMPAHAHIEGSFDDVTENLATVDLQMTSESDAVENKFGYLSTLRIEAAYAGFRQLSETDFFQDRDRSSRFSSAKVLCPAIFSSAFSAHFPEELVQHHRRSVESKALESIVHFLQEHVDPGVVSIDLTDKAGAKRFQVTHADFPSSVDIARFGDGLQRTFAIALAFASAQHGVMLIDEIENAVHVGLIQTFARLIEELAKRFSVQVFLTTHSKECVDAFVRGGCDVGEISGYGLGIAANSPFIRHVPGEELKNLIELFDADLRVAR